MGVCSRIFIVFSLFFISGISAATEASAACTAKTARQSGASAQVLCGCSSVTTGMLRYIQRRSDFDSILASVSAECPALADLLTDVPTASIGAQYQRSGDGPADEAEPTNRAAGQTSRPSRGDVANDSPGRKNDGPSTEPEDEPEREAEPEGDREPEREAEPERESEPEGEAEPEDDREPEVDREPEHENEPEGEAEEEHEPEGEGAA